MSALTARLKGGKSNADSRRNWIGKDQHGREWFANLDLRSGEPVGRIEPHGWGAPWYPDQKYILRDGDFYNVVIDYERMIEDHVVAHREYEARQREVGLELHGQAYDEKKPTNAVKARVGQGPTPLEIVVAMAQGNRYAIGLTDVPDERLRKFLPKTTTAAERSMAGMDFHDKVS